MMIFRPLVALGLILALATAAADAAPSKSKSSFKKPTKKAHHFYGVIVDVGEHHITIRTHHHKKKSKATPTAAGGSKKHHHHLHTFKITPHTTVDGKTGPHAIASLHKHEHVSIKAEGGIAEHIHKAKHHGKKLKKKK